MNRFALLAAALTVVMGASDARAQDTPEVKRLKAKIELLQAKLEAAILKIEKLQNENRQLKASRKGDVSKRGKRKLSEIVTTGKVLSGDFVTTNMGKANFEGKAILTVTQCKGKTFKGNFRATRPGKTELQHDVTGSFSDAEIFIKSVGAPNPFKITGRLNAEYLTLLFRGPFTKATVKLKVE